MHVQGPVCLHIVHKETKLKFESSDDQATCRECLPPYSLCFLGQNPDLNDCSGTQLLKYKGADVTHQCHYAWGQEIRVLASLSARAAKFT